MTIPRDEGVLDITGPLFDGVCDFKPRATILGRGPASMEE